MSHPSVRELQGGARRLTPLSRYRPIRLARPPAGPGPSFPGWIGRRTALHLAAGCIGLAACAKVETTAVLATPGSPVAGEITELIVSVGDGTVATGSQEAQEAQQQFVRQGMQRLQAELVGRFDGYGVRARSDGRSEAGTLVLRSTFRNVTGGNRTARAIIGFGVGKAELSVDTAVSVAFGPVEQPVGRFSTRSTTGSMPGAALGLVGGIAGGSAIGIVGAGVQGALDFRKTVDREAGALAEKITEQARTMLLSQGYLLGPGEGSSGSPPRRLPPPVPLPGGQR